MSVPLSSLALGFIEDPRKIELIRNLIEKTGQGKIPWVKKASAITAAIPGFQINFVMGIPYPLGGFTMTWELLTVRDKSESELVRVVNPGTGLITVGGLMGNTPLVQAADDLFKLLNTATADQLDRAINTIKNL